MLARNGAAWVGQRPIEMRVTSEVETAAFHLDPQRSAVGQSIHVLDRKAKRHSLVREGPIHIPLFRYFEPPARIAKMTPVAFVGRGAQRSSLPITAERG